MSEEQAIERAPEAVCDARSVAKEMAKAHGRYLRYMKGAFGLSREEAIKQLREGEEDRQAKEEIDPEQLSWLELSALEVRGEEELALELWEECRRAAIEEVRGGHRAARAIEAGVEGGPMGRARFLAIRDELRAEWRPTPGSESLLVDQLAQAHAMYERALELYVYRSTYGGLSTTDEERRLAKQHGTYLCPRITEQESLEASLQAADRWQRSFLRTLRALRDLRRHAPQIVVQHAGQVNVGQQQVNVNTDSEGA